MKQIRHIFYTDEVLKWDKKSKKKNQQSLTVSSRVNFGFDVSCNTPDDFLHKPKVIFDKKNL